MLGDDRQREIVRDQGVLDGDDGDERRGKRRPERVAGAAHANEPRLVAVTLVVVRPVLTLDVDDADGARGRQALELGRPPLGTRIDLHLDVRVERHPARRVEVRRDDEPHR